MTLNSMPDCSMEEYSTILKNKYGNEHEFERAFYHGLWCINDSMKKVSEGQFQAILPYIEYPLNELIKNVESHQGDEIYFETACMELQKIYSNLVMINICCIEHFGTNINTKKTSKKNNIMLLAKKIIKR